jgi:DNA replication initiation complex subunit (GINS family)
MTPSEPLSFDEIHSVQRRERSTRNLAKVPVDFYRRLSTYLKEARRELEVESSKGPSPRVLLLQGQFRNLEETAREIVLLRLRKVSEMSFTVVEGGSLNERVLTEEEREFAVAFAAMIEKVRGTALKEPMPATGGPTTDPLPVHPSPGAVGPPGKAAGEPAPGATARSAPPGPSGEAAPGIAHLRILADIPPFEGENKHVYRLRKEDLVTLPRDLAAILVRRKKAVEMQAPA